MTKGYAAPEAEHAYARALELCGQMGDSRRAFPGLMGLAAFHLARAELQTARTLIEQCFSLAQGTPSPARVVGAHFGLGTILFDLGEFLPSRAHLEQGIALDSPQQSRPAHAVAAPGVECYSLAAVTLWLLGYPEQARKRSEEALALHQGVARPFNLAFTLRYAATLHQLLREEQTTRVHAEACIALCREQEFGQVLAAATIFRGWALAAHGQAAEGIVEMGQGLTAFEATGAKIARPHLLALLAEAYGKAGQPAEGLMVLAEALIQVENTGERNYEAELYRLKGELTLQKQSKVTSHKSKVPSSQEAEAYFQKAIEIARKQQAKSLELRATMSLARLWQRQGKKDEARQLLAEIYGWFTEGFDTKDLQEAKRLLEELR